MGTAEDLAVRHPGGYFPTGAVYYWMFPQFYIEHFTNGPQSQAQFALASGWVERYGPALEPEERAELDGQLTEEIAAFNTPRSPPSRMLPRRGSRIMWPFSPFEKTT